MERSIIHLGITARSLDYQDTSTSTAKVGTPSISRILSDWHLPGSYSANFRSGRQNSPRTILEFVNSLGVLVKYNLIMHIFLAF